ncbi:hypothetical protein K523DRAFT_345970 [Schizophyllum commune Tattone D]|nr:hypothetical protein K523DRAFT_345970 [Schizophyllum commune Tattone D]
MAVIHPSHSAVSTEGYQHPTNTAHPSSTVIIRRTRSRNPKVHDRYFLADGNLGFELEDGTMYRVHRHFFTQYSESFAIEYLSSPASTSFVRPKGIETRDFDRFLSLLYPSKIGELDISTADEWLSVLRLAERWAFVDLRKLARQKLDALASPAECDDIAPFPKRAKVAGESGFTDWLERAPIGLHDASANRRDDSLRLPTDELAQPSEAMASDQPEPDKGLDGVDALDILQRVQASMRAMLDTGPPSDSEGSSLDGEGASLKVEGASSEVAGSTSNVEGASLDVEGQPSDVVDVPASSNALLSSTVSHDFASVTHEPGSTTDLLRELPFDISTPPTSFEPSLSSGQAPPRHRESIQDRLQRVVGKEPPKRAPSLWSSFRRGFVDGYNSALLRNGYDGASSTRGCDNAPSTGGSPQPDAPFSPSSPTRSEECSSSKEDHEQTQMSSAREPEDQVARSDEERLARSEEERVIGSGEETPALSYENRARDDEEDRVRRRQERMARYREEFNADLRAQVKRTRESMNRARETASRWMDIFGRTTYSSAFYGELMEENGVNEVGGADERV